MQANKKRIRKVKQLLESEQPTMTDIRKALQLIVEVVSSLETRVSDLNNEFDFLDEPDLDFIDDLNLRKEG